MSPLAQIITIPVFLLCEMSPHLLIGVYILVTIFEEFIYIYYCIKLNTAITVGNHTMLHYFT